MKYARFTRVTDNKVFEVELDDELFDLFRETGEYIEKMKVVVDAAINLERKFYDDDAYEWHDKLTKAINDLEKSSVVE